MKVKSERKQQLVETKSLEIETEKLQVEVTQLMQKVSDLKIDISEKCDALKKSDNDVKKLNAESISLHKTNSDLCSKIQSLISESNKKDTKVQLFPCSNCNFKSETPALLQQHVLQTHCQNKQSQVDASLPTVISGEPLFEYCCFY